MQPEHQAELEREEHLTVLRDLLADRDARIAWCNALPCTAHSHARFQRERSALTWAIQQLKPY